MALDLRQSLGGHFANISGVVGGSGGLEKIMVMDGHMMAPSVLVVLVMRRRRRGRNVMVMLVVFLVLVLSERALLFLPFPSGLFIDLLHGPELLLKLHAPVLEPDLDLPLREAESVSDFDSSPPCQVVVKVEFLFQFQRLVARVRLATPPPRTAIGPCYIRREEEEEEAVE